ECKLSGKAREDHTYSCDYWFTPYHRHTALRSAKLQNTGFRSNPQLHANRTGHSSDQQEEAI
ncbi:hypothetical protein M9458_047564, partial [Cirrhinus mrigala]